FLAAREAAHPTVMTINIEIANPAVFGCRVRDLDELREIGVVLLLAANAGMLGFMAWRLI
ncbi:MAG: hypothetical protein HQL42_20380, partial [Alphaproteobacteria bacterium]|nr:hypothetical protein [Alphaproteobacteria bacterium]